MKMAGKKRKKSQLSGKKKEEGEDRISQLPDALLHHIFSFMQTVDAVKTCVLSRRWMYVWMSLPFLNFDSAYYNYYLFKPKKREVFVKLINQVLMRRDSVPIIKFCYITECDVEPSTVESWIYYAVKHQVQHLQLLVGFSADTVEFPRCFYGCQSLTILELDAAESSIDLPASLGLPSLKSLRLANFIDFNGSIFSTCPNLEILKLDDIRMHSTHNFSISVHNLKGLDIFHEIDLQYTFCDCEVMIDAPKLMNFKYDGPAPFLCSTQNLITLDHVEIIVNRPPRYYDVDPEEQQKLVTRMLGMLNQFHSANFITVSFEAIEYLSLIPSTLEEHPSPFSNLKHLTVRRDYKDVSIPINILNYFLKSSNGAFKWYEVED